MRKVILVTGLLVCLASEKKPCEKPQDLQFALGPCARNGTRPAFFYWKTDCEGGAVPLPLWNLQCDIECPPGSYLTLNVTRGQSQCEQCPPHTFSLSGIERISGARGDWLQGQHRFTTLCWAFASDGWSLARNCSAWTATAGSLSSGTFSSDGWLQQDLVYYANISTPGNLSITYLKTNSAVDDSFTGIFQVVVNGKLVLYDTNQQEDHASTVVLGLSPGPTDIIMSFRKHNRQSAVNITDFEVSGLSSTALFCTPCLGGISVAGSTDCVKCAENTYFEESSHTCERCPSTHYSLPGSIGACRPREKCTAADYVPKLSACINGKRSLNYEWRQPLICGGGQLPAAVLDLPCESCDAGYYMKPLAAESLAAECSPCPEGFAKENDPKVSECRKCPAGTYAPKVIHVTHWTPLPPGFEIRSAPAACRQYSSWHVSSGLFDTSYLNSSTATEFPCDFYFQRTVNTTDSHSFVSFHISFHKSAGSKSWFKFEVDWLPFTEFRRSISTEFETVKVVLQPGIHILRWSHHQEEATGEDECLVFSILITGTGEGGAENCITCPTNQYSTKAQELCLPCPPGYVHSEGHLGCTECSNGTVSSTNGCVFCPSNTEGTSDHIHCAGLDILQSEGMVFNVSLLTGHNGVSICTTNTRISSLCNGPFYGPVSDSFFVSVMNAGSGSSLDLLPGDKRSAYAWGLFPSDKKEGECAPAAVLASLGTEIEGIQINASGFKVKYAKGDNCPNRTREFMSAEIDFVCDKYEGDGWPLFRQSDTCHFSFTWRSKFACRQCNLTDLQEVKGRCINGFREVHYNEPLHCYGSSSPDTAKEPCSVESDATFPLWPLVLGAGAILLLAGAVAVLIWKLCNVQYMYMRLLQEADPRPDKDN